MKMKLDTKKLVCGLMALVMTATVLTGCGGDTASSAKKKSGKRNRIRCYVGNTAFGELHPVSV